MIISIGGREMEVRQLPAGKERKVNPVSLQMSLSMVLFLDLEKSGFLR